MHSPNTIERSWWRRLARRKRAEAARTNRLSHFEPLEQRTVLSASIFVPGGGDFFQTPHDAYRYDSGMPEIYEVASQHEFLGAEHYDSDHYGPEPHPELISHDPFYAPHSHEALMPILGMSHDLPFDSHLTPAYTTAGEGESSALASKLLNSGTPTFAAPQLQTSTTFKVDIVIVHDDGPLNQSAVVIAQPVAGRMSYFTPSYATAVDNGIYASLYAAAMQRRVDPPPGSYGNPSRLGSLNAMTEDTGSAAGKSLESTLQSNSASLLAALNTGSGVNPSASSHISFADDESSSGDQPLMPSRSTGDDTDGLTELSAADLAQKRKLAASTESGPPIQTRLDDLTDIPVIRITESLFRELLVQYENSSSAAAQPGQPVNNADDGLIELIAADTGSLAAQHAITGNDHSQPVALDSGIALQQTLEVAGLDDISEVAAAVQTAPAPVAPTEQIARAE